MRIIKLILIFLTQIPLTCHGFVIPSNYAKLPSNVHQSGMKQKLKTVAIDNTVETQESSFSESEIPYDWKKQWYALTFSSYIENPSKTAEAVPASVFGEPLVLWREKDNGPVFCARDVCPHRSAALSEGRVRDGKLECLYHGWQFKGQKDGECDFIPQLSPDQPIPKRACLQLMNVKESEGIVWVWMDESSSPHRDPPRTHDLDLHTGTNDGFIINDFQIDLPYDHSYLVENLIDPAHIPISHDKTSGGGKRENAQAYEMQVDKDSFSSTGFTGRYRNTRPKIPGTKDDWIETRFEAPGIVRYRSENPKILFGGALHCMPLALGRSRLLFRVYFKGIPKFARLLLKLKPKWALHLNSCKVLEQDAGLIATQEDYFARNPQTSPKKDFLLLSTSDAFVGAYRKWLDQVGHGMPWFQGLASSSPDFYSYVKEKEVLPPGILAAKHRAAGFDTTETRYHRHVIHCPNTRNALKNIQTIKKASIIFTLSSITLGLALSATPFLQRIALLRKASQIFVSLSPLFALCAGIMTKLESRFFVSFKRRHELRTSEVGI